VGINLTQANVVFLMEPCFNPALEAQAVGRVWRLGQQRPVEIVRLQIKDSIEGRICKMLEKKFNDGNRMSSNSAEDGENPRCPNTLIGSLRMDKSSLMADEFDLLFGLESSLHRFDSPFYPDESESDEDESNSSSDCKDDDDDDDEEEEEDDDDDDDNNIFQSEIF
jgi:superfamily II DNA or RNA helicase